MHMVAVGGSDAGISAALRAREADPGAEVTVVAADAYPNFSICGIPYFVSGEVGHWRDLAHRTIADLEAAGMTLRLDTTARRIDLPGRKLLVTGPGGNEELIGYDQLVIGTGAVPVRPPIAGLDLLGAADGVHLLHSMGDTFALMRTLEQTAPHSAIITGAGYIGLEMADALTTRGLAVTQLEQLPEVLPTVDPELGALVHAELAGRGVEVLTGTTVTAIGKAPAGEVSKAGPAGKAGKAGPAGRLRVEAVAGGEPVTRSADLVLVVVGVRPDTDLAVSAGASLGARGAIDVDRRMRTGLPGIYAAGDCVVTHHRLLGETYLPLGTTAHKQGRVAGENAAGGNREFAGSLGTQVVKIFDQAAARTGLRDHEARAAGYDPVTVGSEADDHKAYYPGSHRIAMRFTGDRRTGRLLGVQLFGHKDAEIAKRIDIAAAAIFHSMAIDQVSDLDLSYTPPLGSPWDAVQAGAQAWTRGAPLIRLRYCGVLPAGRHATCHDAGRAAHGCRPRGTRPARAGAHWRHFPGTPRTGSSRFRPPP
jgi:NADPH-dependent 2,4-dienoyl-CoA reductase/sulfur reductase-like enzyme